MKSLLTFIFAFLMLPVLAQQGEQAKKPIDLMQVIPNDPEVRTGTLESGIKYYIRKNSKDPKRGNFHIVYDVGAIQEEDNQNGLAHFLEHMAFNGSKNFANNTMIDYLKSIGVAFGENLNAGTGQEMTTYMITNVPLTRQSIVDSVLLILHDWAGFISLEEEDIDKERGVIIEEWRLHNNADMRVLEKQQSTIFNNSIYAKRNIIGNEEVLKSFTYDDLRSFYHKWYRPDMQAFIIVGDFDVDQMEAKLKQVMADIKPFDVKTPKNKVVIEDNDQPLISILTDPEKNGTVASIYFRHKPIAKKYADRVLAFKSDLINDLIDGMLSERIQDISRKENAPILDSYVSYSNLAEPCDAFFIAASARNNESTKALESIYTELLRMQRGGFVTSEIERAKTNLLTKYERQAKNSNDRRNDDFIDLYTANFLGNSPYSTPEYNFTLATEILADITADEINAVAKSLVRDNNSAFLISAPASTTVPTEADVRALLEKVKASEIALFKDDAKIEPLVDESKIVAGKVVDQKSGEFDTKVLTLSNGVRVVLKKTDFKADEVMMSSSQMGGFTSIKDLNDLASLRFYEPFSMNAGLGNFSQSDLRKVLTGKVASASVGFGDLTCGVKGSCAPKDLETMMQLTYLRITAPRFQESDFNVVMNQYKSLIPNLTKSPDYIFAQQMIKTAYNNNPRAMFALPSMEFLNMVSLARMEAMYKAQFANANGMVFNIVGNFDEAVIIPLIEKYLGSLPSTSVAVPITGTYYADIVKGEVKDEFKTKMETPKVTAAVCYSGSFDYTFKERTTMEAVTYILRNRYIKSIREEAGGTYSVRVQNDMRRYPKSEFEFAITFGTDTSKINELLPIVYKEIDDLIKGNITPESVAEYREFAIKKFAESNINNRVWLSYMNSWFVWGNNEYTDFVKVVEGISVDTIKEFAAKTFGQNNIITVVQLPE